MAIKLHVLSSLIDRERMQESIESGFGSKRALAKLGRSPPTVLLAHERAREND